MVKPSVKDPISISEDNIIDRFGVGISEVNEAKSKNW